MDIISSQIKHELMEEARYDKDQSIRHVFVSICRRKPTKCRAVHRAPEAIMLQNTTSSPGRFSLALGAKAREKRPGDEVVQNILFFLS